MKIIILGSGGHASVVIEALRSRDIGVFGVTDINAATNGKIPGVPFLGNDDVVFEMKPAEVMLANGCGNRADENGSGLSRRRNLYERFAAKQFKFPPVIHARAIVASDAQVLDGAQIMAGAIVQSRAIVGENVIVNSGAIVEHDCKIGAHAHIAPGAILCGSVTVGEESHIGAGAVVLQSRTVGRGAVVGTGEVIRRDIADGVVVKSHGRET
jgi:UDP-perosamine 4-acetyltransferase